LGENLSARIKAASVRQSDVEQNDVWLKAMTRPNAFGDRCRFPYHLHGRIAATGFQHGFHPAPHQLAVIDKEDSDRRPVRVAHDQAKKVKPPAAP
jgi:hypothetical protein